MYAKNYLNDSCSWQQFLSWLGEECRHHLKNGQKTIKDLFVELQEGESLLYKTNGKLIREVRIVKMRIFCSQKSKAVLYETSQYLPHMNSWRQRNILPSEKLQRDEIPKEAVVRGLREELQFMNEADYTCSFVSEDSTTKISKSYGGVTTTYNAFMFDIDITNKLYQRKYEIKEKDGKIAIFEWKDME